MTPPEEDLSAQESYSQAECYVRWLDRKNWQGGGVFGGGDGGKGDV